MKTKTLLLTTVIILILSATVLAQGDSTVKKNDTTVKKIESASHAMNLFKINLTALVITNISLQ